MQLLKQSTQVVVRIGPFMDAVDAVTPETGITLGAADQAELLKHNGAATVDISAATWAGITGAGGWYDLTLSASHTDTLGLLEVVIQDASVCLPVFARFMVVPVNVWDSLFGADLLQVDLQQWIGTAPLGLSAQKVQGHTVTHAAGAIDAAAIGTGAIDADAIAADAITAAKIATDAIGADEFAQAAADKVWSSAARTLTAFSTGLALSVWDVLETAIIAASSIGLKVKNNLDAAITSRPAAADYTAGRAANLDNLNAAVASRAAPGDAMDLVAGAVDAAALAADAVDEILDEPVEGATTMRQMLRLYASMMLAKASGGGTVTLTFRDLADTKARVTMTVNTTTGDRSAVVLDGT